MGFYSSLASLLPTGMKRNKHLASLANFGRELVSYPRFIRDYRRFSQLASRAPARFDMRWSQRRPCLSDQTVETAFDRHYVLHPAWACRVLAKNRPSLHIDISSSLHFVTTASAFIPVDFYDYRPARLELSNLNSRRADLMKLPFQDGSVESISCMHVIEHVGLGRYGDPLDPEGDLKAASELVRVVSPGGSLLMVVPVGMPQVQFNGHRIYTYELVMQMFRGLNLQQAALIPDSALEGDLMLAAPADAFNRQEYGCGCFWFKRD